MSLFDSKKYWESDPRKAFGAFVASEEFVRLGRRRRSSESDATADRPLRPSSQRIYQTMFNHFANWLDNEGVKFGDVANEHIAAFLDQPADDPEGEGLTVRLASKIRLVYVRILERIFTHLKVEPNPASMVVLDKNKSFKLGKEDGKSFLSSDETVSFMANLPVVRPFDKDLDVDPTWKKRRNRAMLAMLIGAGLKVSEVIAIEAASIDPVNSDGSMPLNLKSWESAGTSRPHRAMLRPFAVKEVLAWKKELDHLKIPGKLMFPANLVPKKRKNNRPVNQLDHATVYRIVKEVFVAAGIDVARMGGRTLRNTFAIHELETQPAELVNEFLGHRQPRSTQRYMPYTSKASKLKRRAK